MKCRTCFWDDATAIERSISKYIISHPKKEHLEIRELLGEVAALSEATGMKNHSISD